MPLPSTTAHRVRRLSGISVILALLAVPVSARAEMPAGSRLVAKPAPPPPKKNKPAPHAPAATPTTPPPATPTPAPSATPTPVTPAPTEPAPATTESVLPTEAPERAVYVGADFSFIRADLGGFSNKMDFDTTGANGTAWAIGGGVRLKDIRLGARIRVNNTTEFSLWAFMLEAGYAMKMRPLAPTFFVHLGYTWASEIEATVIRSQLPGGIVQIPVVPVRGLLVGGEVVANYHVTPTLQVGPFLGLDLMILHRLQADFPTRLLFPGSAEDRAKPIYTEGGLGVGYILTLGIKGAFEIGF